MPYIPQHTEGLLLTLSGTARGTRESTHFSLNERYFEGYPSWKS